MSDASHAATVSDEMVTVFAATDPADQARVEAMLREHGVPFAVRNSGVQHLVGAGQIGGVNLVTGPPEIQVAVSDSGRATLLIRNEPGRTETPDTEAEPAEDAAAMELALRYARYSAVWAVLFLWGLGSLLGTYYGIQSLRRSRGALTLTKALAVFGLTLGICGLIACIVLWILPAAA
ncbi:MAG TPA: hypothetical protein VN493_15835 [Thermoanaerobaculia bacterium]|nr:hypothetical protein [Thermoanaerobaculia bacterium]